MNPEPPSVESPGAAAGAAPPHHPPAGPASAVPSTGRAAPGDDHRGALASLVAAYRLDANAMHLHLGLAALADAASAEALIEAAEPYRDLPEVIGPLYERVVALQPTNARALVILANAYWLAGRGPAIVGQLADRARAADPANRGAWHLWALSEARPRERVERWRRVCHQFPDDDLARANLADNAASLAGAEHDAAALQLALDTYVDLRARSGHPDQRAALDRAIVTLRGWKL